MFNPKGVALLTLFSVAAVVGAIAAVGWLWVAALSLLTVYVVYSLY